MKCKCGKKATAYYETKPVCQKCWDKKRAKPIKPGFMKEFLETYKRVKDEL